MIHRICACAFQKPVRGLVLFGFISITSEIGSKTDYEIERAKQLKALARDVGGELRFRVCGSGDIQSAIRQIHADGLETLMRNPTREPTVTATVIERSAPRRPVPTCDQLVEPRLEISLLMGGPGCW